jgi:hypothetical protein
MVLWARMESWSADGRGWPHAPVWDFQRDGPVAKSLFLNLDGSKAKKKSAKQILIIRAGLLF